MSRQPVDITATGPKNDRQAIWEAIRKLGRDQKPFTTKEIRGELPGYPDLSKIRDYLTCLTAAGITNCKRPARRGGVNSYTLLKDSGIDAPRLRKNGEEVTQGQGQERLWQCLRINRHPLTAIALLGYVNTPEHPIKLTAVKSYLKHLKLAGYLQTCGDGEQRQYLLLPTQNTGTKAPMVQRVKQIWDQNLAKVVWPKEHVNEQ